jgi:autotransporter-associated beta strand protein
MVGRFRLKIDFYHDLLVLIARECRNMSDFFVSLLQKRRSLVSISILSICLLGSIRPLLAESFDYRYLGGFNWNTPAKSQFGGTCWAHGPTSCVEAKYMLSRNDTTFVPDFSEQQLAWETDPDLGSTQGGGGFEPMLDYYMNHGVVADSVVPVYPDDDYWDAPPAGTPVHPADYASRCWKIGSWMPIADNSAANLKSMLKLYGPIVMGFNASDMYGSVADLKANYTVHSNGDNHAVSLVGYYDDATCPTGGYWVIKNSWGTGDGENGFRYVPYNSSLEGCGHLFAITGPAYYSNAMASATWKGGSNTWSSAGTNWTNDSGGATYSWENKETNATFNASIGTTITVTGKVIGHAMTISSGATGYVFNAGAPTNSSITLTAGLTANESVTFNAPVYIGGPQSWNAASGKTITVAGALHTIISDLTFSGAGNKVISGAIDGGGVANINGGAKPGGLIQAGTGTLTISGTSNFAGDITAQAGSGTLYIAPPGGGAASFTGGFMGGGSIDFNCSSLTLGGGTSNFTGTMTWAQPTSITFAPATGIVGTFANVFNNNGSVTQNGPGTTILTGGNTYTGSTTISNGALQANVGTGIPSNSSLVLDGGVLQGNGSTTFSQSIGTTGGKVQWTANGGGFAANGGTMTVKLNNNTTTAVLWGTDANTQIAGTLKFGSTSATSSVDFQNKIDLNGLDRTIQVNDNPSTIGDTATMSGAIVGSAGITKTGSGLLKLTGGNTYNGTTTIAGGILQANIGSAGIPTNSFLSLDGGVLQFNGSTTSSFTRSLGTSGSAVQWGLGGGGFSAGTTSLTVSIGGTSSPTPLVWSSSSADIGTKLLGPLTLNATTASRSLTLKNSLDLAGGARSIYCGANTVYLQGGMSDSVGGGSLTKTGTATLYLNGAGSSYTGSTSLIGGNAYFNTTSGYAIPGDLILGGNTQMFVNVVGSNQIATTSKWTWTGTGAWQELKLFGHSQTVTGLVSNTGGAVIESTWDESGYDALTLTINNSTDCFYRGVIRDTCYGSTGALAIVKTESGTQTIASGDISYTGGTTIDKGKLVFQDVTNSDFAARPVTNNSVFGLCAADDHFTFSGVISGSGSVEKTGGNRLTIAGSSGNTYAGSTTISEGTTVLAKTSGYAIPGSFTISNGNTYVVVQNPDQFPASAKVSFTGTGDPHFEMYGNTVTVAGISGTGGGAIQNTEGESGPGNGTLIVNNADDCSYHGIIRNNAGGSGTLTLVKSGTGTLTLNGPYSSEFTGGLVVNGGTLDFNGASNIPVCNYTITGGSLNTRGLSRTIGTFQITGGTVTGTGALTSASPFDIQAGNVNVRLSGAVALNKTGSGTAILTTTNTYTGATNISAGTLQLGNGGSTGTIANSAGVVVSPGATFDVNRSGSISFTSKISGTGTLVKNGLGTLTLSGNSFSGNLRVNDGALTYSGTSTLPVGNYTVTGGALNLGARTQSIGVFQITGGSVTGTGTLTSSADFDVQAGSVTQILGGTTGLNKTGSGSASVASPTYTGATSVADGILTFTGSLPGGNYAISGGKLNIGALIKSIGTLQISGGTLAGTGKLTSSSTYDLRGGTIEAILAGNYGLTKSQTGTAVLKGANTYTGTTLIDGGVLALSAGGQISALSTIDCRSTFLVNDGSHTVGNITGPGVTLVGNGAQLTAHSIVQDTLTVGGNYGSLLPASAAVPEPGVLVLLALAIVPLAALVQKKKK